MSEISDEEFDLDVLMRRIRADVERRRAAGAFSGESRTPAMEGVAPADDSPDPLRLERLETPASDWAPKERYSVADFLQYHDEEFLRCVYRGVLRRNPDATGFASFLEQLRRGSLSKVDVLGRIRYSSEGRAAGVPIDGLRSRFALRTMRRIPVIGRLIAVAQHLVRLPDVVASHERFEADVLRRDAGMRRQVDANNARIEQRVLRLEGAVRAASGALHAELGSLALRVDEKADRDALRALAERMPTPPFGADARFDAFYMSLEDRFRGTREDIVGRVQVYIPVMRAANAGTGGRPIVDIGCGRGEWLEAFRHEGLEGYGVDANPAMVEHCLARDVHAVLGDGLEHLRSLPSSSLGAITAMHVAEHLPFSGLLALVEESLRVLLPGGALILETPNPENVLVGSGRFYIDPTHQRPIPPPLLHFVAEHLGFADVEVMRLHPALENDGLAQSPANDRRLNEFFFGAQDYAIVARKPMPREGARLSGVEASNPPSREPSSPPAPEAT